MSGAPLDMTLDDLIKKNKKSGGGRGGGRGGRGGASGLGPARRVNKRVANRPGPYAAAPKAPESAWKHDMFASDQAMAFAGQQFIGAGVARASSIETGTKLYVSNLDYGVSNEDLKELFSEVGDLKRCSIHYDRSGRSKGTAEIVFSRRENAIKAVKRYNNVQLDGKPMKIEIVGTNVVTPAAGPPLAIGAFGYPIPNVAPMRSTQGRGGSFGRPRGGGGQGRGRGRGTGERGRGRGRGERGEKVSAEALDAELENYHKEAMQEN